MKFLVFFFFVSVCAANKVSYFPLLDKLCEKYIHYEPMCYFYNFADNCYPWLLDDCELLTYSAHEANCITYECSVTI